MIYIRLRTSHGAHNVASCRIIFILFRATGNRSSNTLIPVEHPLINVTPIFPRLNLQSDEECAFPDRNFNKLCSRPRRQYIHRTKINER